MSLRGRVRELVDRTLDRWYEGPRPPSRIGAEVEAWLRMNPTATPQQVAAFAVAHSREAYQQGFLRGLEWRERGLLKHEEADAARAEEEARHAWQPPGGGAYEQWMAGQDGHDPLAAYPPEERARVFDALGQAAGSHRVIYVSPAGEEVAGAEVVARRRPR